MLSSRALSQLVYAISLIDGDGQLDLANPRLQINEEVENGDNIGVHLLNHLYVESEFRSKSQKQLKT